MMKKHILAAAGVIGMLSSPAIANDRYQSRPPVVVSPDLTAPWVVQLGGARVQPVVYPVRPMATQPRGLFAPRVIHPLFGGGTVQPVASMHPGVPVIHSTFDPQYLPQIVDYQTKERPGTIVIDTDNRFLYLVIDGGKARRYIVFKDLDGRQKWVACPNGTTIAQAKMQLAAAETNVANGKVGIAAKPSAETIRAKRITLSSLIDRFCAEYTNPQVKDIDVPIRGPLRTHHARQAASDRVDAGDRSHDPATARLARRAARRG